MKSSNSVQITGIRITWNHLIMCKLFMLQLVIEDIVVT